MTPPVQSEQAINLRLVMLSETVTEAERLLAAENVSRFELLRCINRLTSETSPLESSAPTGAASKEATVYWDSNILPVLLKAIRMKSDLQTLQEVYDHVNMNAKKPEPESDDSEDTEVGSVIQGVNNIRISESTPHRPKRATGTNYLPKHIEIKLPTFSGNCAEYPLFISAFRAYTNTPTIDDSLKFLILVNHLKDSAALHVRGLHPSAESLEKALRNMDKFYNDKNRIVDALETKLYDLKPATDKADSLRSTYLEVESLLSALEQNGVNVDADDKYRRQVLSKYPERIQTTVAPGKMVKMTHLREDMLTMIDQLQDVESARRISAASFSAPKEPETKPEVLAYPAITDKKGTRDKEREKDRDRRSGDHRNRDRDERKRKEKKCTYCNETHFEADCKKYVTADDRKRALPDNHCFSCLVHGHSAKNCRSTKTCFHCHRWGHHSSLCYQRYPSAPKVPEKESKDDKSETDKPREKKYVSLVVKEKSMLMTSNAVARNPKTGLRIRVRVFVDPGAEDTYTLTELQRRLRLDILATKEIDLYVFPESGSKRLETHTVEFELLSELSETFVLTVRADTVDTMPKITTTNLSDFRRQYPLHSDLTYAEPLNGEPIDILIGIDYCWNILQGQPVEVDRGVHLVDSVFGWIVCGKLRDEPTNSSTVLCSVKQAVSTLWDVETLGIREPDLTLEKEEELALELFKENIRYIQSEKRYEVGWPWRSFPPQLPTNFGLAWGILHSLHKRAHPDHLRVITDTLTQQLQSGIIEEVHNPQPIEGKTSYLPYHLVIKEASSTPARMVFNGSAKSSAAQKSLNENLYKGLNLLPDLISILLRSRFGKYLLSSDIEKAFHQLLVKESDRDYLRFLVKTGDRVRTFRFRRVPFGIVTSPFMLAAVIHEVLNTSDPSIATIIKNNLYVDNLIVTYDNIDDAIRFQSEAIQIFDRASMYLRKLNSNADAVRESVETARRDDTSVVSILGAKWDRTRDVFNFPAPSASTMKFKSTMRSVLKIMASVFDPLGLFSPVTVRAKAVLRSCHDRNAKWDDRLTDSETALWRDIHRDLISVSSISIPRRVHDCVSSDNRYSYHVFSDASKLVYAFAIYVRIESETKTTCHLLFAKARFAPTRKEELTIPKLELMAALIAARGLSVVRNALPIVECRPATFWIDSRCVLAWLHSRATLTTFVRNRVSEILKTNNANFRYVASAQNIADLPTRYSSLAGLRENQEWWNGPAWLSFPDTCWPTDFRANEVPPTDLDDLEQEKKALAIAKKSPPVKITRLGIDPAKYTEYLPLIRTSVHVLRFLTIKFPELAAKFSTNLYQSVVEMWVLAAQAEGYSDVLSELRAKTQRKSEFTKKVRPYLDERQILRFGGRFGSAPLPAAERHPIILPQASSNNFTALLVHHIHVSLKHGGPQATLAAFQRKWWMPQGRREVHKILRRCPACSRETARPYDQPTESSLPDFRLDSGTVPFKASGIDICGPFFILKEKKWILLVTCLVMRGIALEVLDSLETYHIHDAMKRVAARRTMPSLILSDNAAQFRLLAAHLQKNTTEQLEWRNIPQYSPWYGGAYERLNAVFKSALYRCMHEQITIGPVQFRTIVFEIEAAVNSRPLTAVTATPEIRTLTPNDLLRVTSIIEADHAILPASDTKAAKALAEMSGRCKQLTIEFWREWKSSYLQYLRERDATQQFQGRRTLQTPKVGDIVIVRDDLRRKSQWKLARIEELTESRDNVVRSAIIRLGTGNRVSHPIKDLFRLEITDEPFGEVATPENDVEVETLGVNDLNVA